MIAVCDTATVTGDGEHTSGEGVGTVITTTPPDAGDCVGVGVGAAPGIALCTGAGVTLGAAAAAPCSGKKFAPTVEQLGMIPEIDSEMNARQLIAMLALTLVTALADRRRRDREASSFSFHRQLQIVRRSKRVHKPCSAIERCRLSDEKHIRIPIG
jgi:hypothetical protein